MPAIFFVHRNGLPALPEGAVNLDRARRQRRRSGSSYPKALPSKTQKPRIPGLCGTQAKNKRARGENWHALCNNLITTQFRGPWYRQAGDS
ncbi:hypothetical protein M1B34_22535, partial [Pseudomonas sp. MAFF 302030]|nr:hypothetical protein [Pseudomonas morbosilactucae]